MLGCLGDKKLFSEKMDCVFAYEIRSKHHLGLYV